MEKVNPPLRRIFELPGLLVLVLWLVFMLDFAYTLNLNAYGLRPRELRGLVGILTSPFLHGDIFHLLSNTFSLFLLTASIRLFYPKLVEDVLLLLYPLSGITVWLFARGGTVHIGASGVIYGLAGFLLFCGFFRRELRASLLALAVGMVYGGLVQGLLPQDPHISWEGHLSGFVWGAVLAFIFRRRDAFHDEPEIPQPALGEYEFPEGFQRLENKHFRVEYREKE